MKKPTRRRRQRLERLATQPDRTSVGVATSHRKPHDSLQLAIGLHQQGRLAAARDAYCQFLAEQPQHDEAWHMLGMLLFQGQDYAGAKDCVQRSLKYGPATPEKQSNLGLIERALGNLDQALSHLKAALRTRPDSVNFRSNLGTVLMEQHNYEAAEAEFRAALALDPNHENALTNLGTALQHQRRYVEAQTCHEQALRVNPNSVQALNNLGSVLKSQRQMEAASRAFKRAVQLAPRSEEAQVNLGRTLVGLRQLPQAVERFEQLLQVHPQSAPGHHHLGHTLLLLDRHEAAMSHLERAVEIDPHYAHALGTLGNALLRRGDSQGAIARYRQALEIRPDLHETHSNLLFLMSNDPRISAEELYNEHRNWGQQHGQVETPFTTHQNDPSPNRRLRVGYVSPDLRDHAVARFLLPVLEHHRKTDFEIFCYAHVFREDEVTETLKQKADHWRSTCGLSYRQAAELIHEDQIDLLIDLAGHTAGNRLLAFAYRPAPVQISWLGYPNTTGLPAMNYRLTSEIQDPVDEPSCHTETLVRLEVGTNCFTPPSNTPPVASPPARRNGFITFGSLHRPQKISIDAIDLWAQVLKATPSSKLLLFNTYLKQDSQQFIRRELESRGVAAARVTMRNEIEGDTYLTVYDEIDIGLDVFPWNGGTTTREALWMGVAVVGLLGDRRSARGTAATLHYAGLPELVASDPSAYVQLTSELAQDLPRLEAYRLSLRERLQETICNGSRFTQCMEKTLRTLWHHWCSRQST